MPVAAECECGASYSLKDEFAGKKLNCPRCDGPLVAPQLHELPAHVRRAVTTFDRDRFLIRQKRFPGARKYFVADDAGGDLLFVNRPGSLSRNLLKWAVLLAWLAASLYVAYLLMTGTSDESAEWIAPLWVVGYLAGHVTLHILLTPKRHVYFFQDRSLTRKLMTVRQDFRQVLLNARYTLLDDADRPQVVFRKNMLYNILRRRWYVEDPSGRVLFVAREDSILRSILRRLIVPLKFVMPLNFIITTPDYRTVLGSFNRKFTLFDRYVLDLARDPDRLLDRRMAVALGVMLDAGERR